MRNSRRSSVLAGLATVLALHACDRGGASTDSCKDVREHAEACGIDVPDACEDIDEEAVYEAPCEGDSDGSPMPGAPEGEAQPPCDGEGCLPCCDAATTSRPPLGRAFPLEFDEEIAVLGEGAAYSAIQVVDVAGDEAVDVENFELGSVRDMVGANLLSERRESLAVAFPLDGVVEVYGNETTTLPIEGDVAALAAVDADFDLVHELVIGFTDGALDVCDVPAEQCERVTTNLEEIEDLTSGDVDGDGVHELIAYASGTLTVLHIEDGEAIAELAFSVEPALAITAADLSGNGVAELITLVDGGWLGAGEDRLLVHALDAATLVVLDEHKTRRGMVDLEAGDLDADGEAELVVADRNGYIEVRDGSGGVRFGFQSPFASVPTIALADRDGDSPLAVLREVEPEAAPGPVFPVTVMHLPPYYPGLSGGASSVAFGESMSTTMSTTDTITASMNVEVAVGPKFIPAIDGRVATRVSATSSVTQTRGQELVVSPRFGLFGDPSLDGWNKAAGVVAACGCYETYEYEIDDPAGKLEIDASAGNPDERLVASVPVGSANQLMSVDRYNALVAGTGAPQITIPYQVDDPTTYPAPPWSPRTGGTTFDVPEDDMLFSLDAIPTVSSATLANGNSSWFILGGETATVTEARGATMGLSVSGTAGLVTVAVGGEVGRTTGTSLTVGEALVSYGDIPGIPEDAPVDDPGRYAYEVTPVLYRARYGPENESAYYVVSFLTEGGEAGPASTQTGERE